MGVTTHWSDNLWILTFQLGHPVVSTRQLPLNSSRFQVVMVAGIHSDDAISQLKLQTGRPKRHKNWVGFMGVARFMPPFWGVELNIKWWQSTCWLGGGLIQICVYFHTDPWGRCPILTKMFQRGVETTNRSSFIMVYRVCEIHVPFLGGSGELNNITLNEGQILHCFCWGFYMGHIRVLCSRRCVLAHHDSLPWPTPHPLLSGHDVLGGWDPT